MPAFSVDSELSLYFPGHADAFQILLYGVQFFRGLLGFHLVRRVWGLPPTALSFR